MAPTAENARQAWDKASGIAQDQQENVSYVKELLLSPWNKLGWFGTAVVVALSAVFGMGVLILLPILAWFLFQTLTVLYVPGTKWFQKQVQDRKSGQQRERTREILLAKLVGEDEINRRKKDNVGQGLRQFVENSVDLNRITWQYEIQDYCNPYHRMRERLDAMKRLAADTETALSDREIGNLEEATLDYLRLVFALLNITDRLKESQDSKINQQIADIDEQLDDEALNPSVRQQLTQAQANLERILQRRASLPARKITMAAQLTAMSETFEELYHRVTSNPSASISDFLDEATSKLSIEEQLTVATIEVAGADEDLQRRLAAVAAKARSQQQAR